MDEGRVVLFLSVKVFAEPVGARAREFSLPKLLQQLLVAGTCRFLVAEHSMALSETEQRHIAPFGGGICDQEFFISLNRVIIHLPRIRAVREIQFSFGVRFFIRSRRAEPDVAALGLG